MTIDLEGNGGAVYTDLSVSGENVDTITIQNWPASPNGGGFIWAVDQDSTPRTITLPGAVIVVGGTAPDPSGVSSQHLWMFWSRDGGTTIYQAVLQDFS